MGAKEQGADATSNRWLCIPRTLSFVFHDSDVLLMKRAAHKRVFPNQYNGLGGHIERYEDPYTSALREIEEESGLQVHNLRLKTIHNIDADAASGILLFVFTAASDRREFNCDSSEGTLEWVPRDQVMKYDLVDDLPQLLPRLFAMTDCQFPSFAHVSYDNADQIQMRFREQD